MITEQGVAVPDDMAAALAVDPAAMAAFSAMRPAQQREYVDWVGRSAGAVDRDERLSRIGAHVLAHPEAPGQQ